MFTKPYIVAELSGNHNGQINNALKLMEIAKEAGADAIKLQTYTPDILTIDFDGPDFIIKGGLWKGYKLYDLYKQAYTPWDWHHELFAKGKDLGIPVFSTPFDETAVDFLEALDTPMYKIASFELVHHPLIAYISKTKKPIIMSTGMASLKEIEEAVEIVLLNGCTDLTLLHCISSYPTSVEDCHLATMVDLKKRFPNCRIGLSDHTLGSTVAITAVALGAELIEKHITLSRLDGGVDAEFSLEPSELKYLCQELQTAQLAIGRVNYERSTAEKKNLIFRRSIYAVKDIKKGELFTEANIRIIRPGYGAAPKHFKNILNRKAKSSYKIGDRL